MEIERKDNKEIKVETLDTGDCFEYHGSFYMRVFEGMIDVNKSPCFPVIAINLRNGILEQFGPDTPVNKKNICAVVNSWWNFAFKLFYRE